MSKSCDIPLSQMRNISDSGIFVKRFCQYGKVSMKSYVHRDDYYIIVLLINGLVAVDIDYERRNMKAGDILIVSPWQVHNKPSDEVWQADGWMLAFSPEMLSETEVQNIEEYSISSLPFNPGDDVVGDIDTLCSILERNKSN